MDQNFHPKEVANLLGVHLRTVFRLLNRGELHKRKGRILKKDIDDVLPLWKSTVSLPEARKKLGVTAATCKSWRDKGILKQVEVLGEPRVTTLSMENAPAKRLAGFVGTTKYFSLSHLVRLIGTSNPTLRTYLGKEITSVNKKGRVLIPRREAVRIEKFLQTACEIKYAAEILGIGDSGVRSRVRTGKLCSTTFLGKVYILFESMGKDPVTKRKIRSYLKKRRKKIIRKAKKLAEKRRSFFKSKALVEGRARAGRGKPFSFGTQPKTKTVKKPRAKTAFVLPDYEPKLLVRVVMERKYNVTSIEEASKGMGVSVGHVEELMNSGTIRFLQDEDDKFPFLTSVKAWIERKRASIKAETEE